MLFNFPTIKTTRTVDEQYDKILEECEEYFKEMLEKKEDLQDKEAIDILHSVETFLRIRFKGREEQLDNLIKFTIEKNTKRGYYEEKCF